MSSTHGPIHIKRVVVCEGRRRQPSSRQLILFYFLILTFVIFKCGSYLLRRPPPPPSSSSSLNVNKSTTTLPPSRKEEITAITNTTTDDNSIIIIPPLKDLIGKNGKIIGDISWMLDFAIIGFPKCGTSFMKDYLNQTEETFVYHREFCIKKPSDLKRFVETYHELHLHPKYNTRTIKFGLKCPGVLYRSYDMKIYEKYFPKTKFIVGIRHPISWFESFYNYQMVRNVSMPQSTATLVGKCDDDQKVCTDRARFHAALARLRKTPLLEKEEIDLLFGIRYENQQQHQQRRQQQRRFLNSRNMQRNGFPNQLLLYEVRQLHQNNDTTEAISETLRKYLDIQQDDNLPPILSYKNVKPRAINICDDVHANVRRILVEHGTDAAVWIKQYLMKNPTVEIASPESFGKLLDSWSVDPCANKTKS
ncbi:hypothetical protein ACHAXM_011402 [Skeletonema potamos]